MRPISEVPTLEPKLPQFQAVENTPRKNFGNDADGLRLLRCGRNDRVDMRKAGSCIPIGTSRPHYLSAKLGLIPDCARYDREFTQLSNGRARNGDC